MPSLYKYVSSADKGTQMQSISAQSPSSASAVIAALKPLIVGG